MWEPIDKNTFDRGILMLKAYEGVPIQSVVIKGRNGDVKIGFQYVNGKWKLLNDLLLKEREGDVRVDRHPCDKCGSIMYKVNPAVTKAKCSKCGKVFDIHV